VVSEEKLRRRSSYDQLDYALQLAGAVHLQRFVGALNLFSACLNIYGEHKQAGVSESLLRVERLVNAAVRSASPASPSGHGRVTDRRQHPCTQGTSGEFEPQGAAIESCSSSLLQLLRGSTLQCRARKSGPLALQGLAGTCIPKRDELVGQVGEKCCLSSMCAHRYPESQSGKVTGFTTRLTPQRLRIGRLDEPVGRKSRWGKLY
jgi:hypothetical protein